uniref:Uncharacterized protein n=1 Tax=Octactis speculum TaxID=3111310 RepID=A0A7S2CCY2_9STRA
MPASSTAVPHVPVAGSLPGSGYDSRFALACLILVQFWSAVAAARRVAVCRHSIAWIFSAARFASVLGGMSETQFSSCKEGSASGAVGVSASGAGDVACTCAS